MRSLAAPARARAAVPGVAFAVALALAFALLGTGCNTYADELSRGQRAFEESEHERALALFRALEPDVTRLSLNDRVRYAYLRGMTDYRIGYKAESRHWLSIAAAAAKQTPGSLPAGWDRRMNEALKDLNDTVYSGGIASLSNTPSASTPQGQSDQGDDDSTSTAKPTPGDE